MREIEVKILEINLEETRKKLLELGAEKIFDGEIEMVAFDYPDNRLKQNDELLRVRKVGDRIELCFKGKKEDSTLKIKEETEVTTSSFKDTIRIFEELGLERRHQGTKKRESYKLGKIRFEIDSWENVPPFLEIEAKTEEEVIEYVKKLGFTMEQTTNIYGREVEEYYRNKNVTKNKTT